MPAKFLDLHKAGKDLWRQDVLVIDTGIRSVAKMRQRGQASRVAGVRWNNAVQSKV
jgi:hypothetical protein